MKLKEIPYLSPKFRAGSFICALVFSGAMALLVRQIPFTQGYRDLVVGYITWNGASKSVDYYMVFVFLASFVASLFILNVVLHLFGQTEHPDYTLESKNKKEHQEVSLPYAKVLLTTFIPAGWWIGAEVIHISAGAMQQGSKWTQPSYEYLIISLGLILLTILIRYILPQRYSTIQSGEAADICGTTLLNFLFAFFAVLSVVTVITFAFRVPYRVTDAVTNQMIVASLLIILLFTVAAYYASKTEKSLKERVLHMMFWLQLPLPFLLFVLIQSHSYFHEVKTTLMLHVTLWSAVISCLFIWYRQWSLWIKTKGTGEYTIESGIVPASMACLLIFMLSSPAPALPSDDYHLGEWYLPWQQMAEFGRIPFVDLNYPHGFVHFIHGFLSQFFFDGTAASFNSANVLLVAIGVIVTFFALNASIGPLASLLIMITFPFTKITSLNLLFIIPSFLVLVHPRMLYQPIYWLMVWIFLSFFLVFYAPSTGIAFTLATIPAAVWVTFRALRGRASRLKGRTLIAAGLFLLIVIGLTPLGPIVRGLFLFLLENSKVNALANSIPWKPSLFGFVGLAWVLVVCALIAFIWRQIAKPAGLIQDRVVLFGAMVLCYLIAIMPYSFGRIDHIGLSRTGILSFWSAYFCISLPVLLMRGQVRIKTIKYLLVVYPVVAGAIYSFNIPGGEYNVESLIGRSIGKVATKAQHTRLDERNAELANLGGNEIGHDQPEELSQLKYLFGKLLLPGETYLDLTNHSARYFYLGYPVPILEAAFYNAPATKTQLRILEQIKRKPPPVVLARARNILFDSGSAALRANLLYRYFVLSYVPLKLGDFIFLVKPERAPDSLNLGLETGRNEGLRNDVQETSGEVIHEARLVLLDKAFRVEHLRKIPVSWGRSWDSLAPLLSTVAGLDASRLTRTIDVQRNEDGSYSLTGKDPQLVFDIAALGLEGWKAGYLTFDVQLDGSSQQPPPELEVRWRNLDYAPDENNLIKFYAENGRMLVPLDSYPRWLLSPGICELTIGLKNCQGCRTFWINNMFFLQRRLLQEKSQTGKEVV